MFILIDFTMICLLIFVFEYPDLYLYLFVHFYNRKNHQFSNSMEISSKKLYVAGNLRFLN